MIRDDSFVLSRRPYAVALDSLTVYEHGKSTLAAVWFRRRRGVTVACIGELWAYLGTPPPADAAEFLARHRDGRHGGDCLARWDGTAHWSVQPQPPQTTAEQLEILRPMLANYPVLPAGYGGWWRF